MPYFIDTNIAIGYTVVHDTWHDSSKRVIDNEDYVFWSNLVKNEYDDKLNDIKESVDFFLKRAKLTLKNNEKDFINFYEFENFIIKKTKMCILDESKKQKILEQFWNRHNFCNAISEDLFLRFKEFQENFEKIYSKR